MIFFGSFRDFLCLALPLQASLVMPRTTEHCSDLKAGQKIKEFGNLNTQSSGLQNILSRPEIKKKEQKKESQQEEGKFSVLSIR